jgi:hypothetical protein
MKINIYTLSLLAIALVFTSCKKEEEPDPAPAMTKTQMLTGNNWVVNSMIIDQEYGYGYCSEDLGNGTYELFPNCFDDCDLDDFWDFETDMSYVNHEGSNICFGVDPILCEGSWSFNTNETVLEISGGDCGFSEYDIISISATQLVVAQTITYNGYEVTFTQTMD